MRRFRALNLRDTPEALFVREQGQTKHILRIQQLTKNLRSKEVVRILDFGCGYGDFLLMCNCFGFYGCGVDFSLHRRKQGVVAILPDIEALRRAPQAQQGFHAITLFQVLEHLAEPLETLKLLNDFVVTGGLLVLETPDRTGVTDIKTITDYRKIHPLSHLNGFTPSTLSGIARRAGFRPTNRIAAHATNDIKKVIKTEAKLLVSKVIRPTTQQYFIKI